MPLLQFFSDVCKVPGQIKDPTQEQHDDCDHADKGLFTTFTENLAVSTFGGHTTYRSFRRLAPLLHPFTSSDNETSRLCLNGPISPDVRLACAICWFARGSTYDIMTTYGISHTDTINSYWYAVDAINQNPRFAIAYPDDHEKQRSIAAGLLKCHLLVDFSVVLVH